jgi:hypothetical protein
LSFSSFSGAFKHFAIDVRSSVLSVRVMPFHFSS